MGTTHKATTRQESSRTRSGLAARCPVEPAKLQFRMLGSLRIGYGQREVPLPATHRAQALLALVAMDPTRARQRAQLAHLLWPERIENDALKLLRTELWRLVRYFRDELSLPFAPLIVAPRSVMFDLQTPLWFDTVEFERVVGAQQSTPHALDDSERARLIDATRLYGGDLLASWSEPWCVAERTRLRSFLLLILERLTRDSLRRGEWSSAVNAAQQLVAAAPTFEWAYRALMYGYRAMNSPILALAQYEALSNALHAQVGDGPGERTRQLEHAIRVGDPLPALEAFDLQTGPSETSPAMVAANHDPLLSAEFVALRWQIARCLEALDRLTQRILPGSDRSGEPAVQLLTDGTASMNGSASR